MKSAGRLRLVGSTRARPRTDSVLLLAAALLLSSACRKEPGREIRIPDYAPGANHLVLITLDTVRADRLSVYGHAGATTPALEAIAREGVRFDNAATTVPFTLPAHSSILTGLYPPRHGVRENVGYVLPATATTLAERLRESGYATAGFVSAFVLDSRWGIGRGFDTYFDDFDPHDLESANLAAAQRDGAETVAAAVRWLDSRPADRPFFLWLHLYDAHDPYTPPEPFASRHPGRPYDAEIAYVDDLVGRFRAELERRALLRRTALVVTADHGEGLGEHGEQYHGFFVYDTTVHVPLLLRLPGEELAGHTVDTAVSHVDLAPTFLELAGLRAPADLDGSSLLGLAGAPTDAARAVYSESLYPLLHYGWAPLRALRDARRKFIDAPAPELYDHAADPGERSNIVRGERAPASALRSQLAERRRAMESGAPAVPKVADLDEETLAQLAALGYMAGQGGVAAHEEGDTPRADPKEKVALHHAIMNAQGALGEENFAVARAELERALAEDAGILDAHQMLGSLAAREKKWEEAIASYRRALALDPEHKASLFGLAAAYRRAGRADEALVGFERLLTLAPQDSKAAIAAADLLVEKGKRREALELLERSSRAAEAPPILANQLGELLAEERRFGEARAEFERAIAANPELAQPRFNLGVIAEESGDPATAMRHYEETIALQPKHLQALFNLGRLAGATGDRPRQEELWRAAVTAHPGFARGRYLLAKLLMDTGGDLGEAERLVREGLSRDEAHAAGPLGYFLLADILNRLGRTAEAGAALESGRRIESEQAAGKKGSATRAQLPEAKLEQRKQSISVAN